jgi:hypothetical protein
VEHGDLRRAELFLNQSRSLGHDDHRVDTEYAYLLLRKAIDSPLDTRSVRCDTRRAGLVLLSRPRCPRALVGKARATLAGGKATLVDVLHERGRTRHEETSDAARSRAAALGH